MDCSKSFRLVSFSALLALVLAMMPRPGHAGELYDLTVNIADMDIHLNQTFELRVVDIRAGTVIDYYRLDRIVGEDFQVMLEDVLRPGHKYNVDFYADANNNGDYDPPYEDHAWRLVVTGVRGDVTLDFSHSSGQLTDVEFDLDPQPACDCDFNGDGRSDIADVVRWLVNYRFGLMDEPCMDWNGDTEVSLPDLIMLLQDMRAAGCMVTEGF